VHCRSTSSTPIAYLYIENYSQAAVTNSFSLTDECDRQRTVCSTSETQSSFLNPKQPEPKTQLCSSAQNYMMSSQSSSPAEASPTSSSSSLSNGSSNSSRSNRSSTNSNAKAASAHYHPYRETANSDNTSSVEGQYTRSGPSAGQFTLSSFPPSHYEPFGKFRLVLW